MKLRSIQVLRGLAALGVVFLHCTIANYGNGPGAFYWGAAGVDIFFVISGFIIGTVSAGQAPLAFLLKRAWRIYPLWWIASAPFAVVALASVPRSLATLTLWPVWAGSFQIPWLTVGWTLSYEMLFYAGAALALAARPALPLAIFAACAVAAPLTDSAAVDFVGNPIVLEFLAGVVIANVDRPERLGVPFLLGGAVALVCSSPIFFDRATAIATDMSALRVLSWGLPAAAIVYGALCLERRFAGRAWDWPVLLGDASYSIYLFHLAAAYGVPGHWVGKAAVSVAAGLAVYFLLERRIMGARLSGLPVVMKRRAAGQAGAICAGKNTNLVQ